MSGPYLYDEDPEPLHTGAPRNRDRQMIAVLVVTVLLAALTVLGTFFFRGSPAERSEEAVGVFLDALAAGDTETAHQLLCLDERNRVAEGEVAAEYLQEVPGEVTGSVDGGTDQLVDVRWSDGSTSTLVVISEQGARICGLR